ncbi:hypothetical protein AVEN_29241-1 [Araneus ventricosus]|uniref:Uncharacterized protein n=1 Tax=Araneus ventricosus TaxID=182803 RepID=A0A4Y2E1R5_ARAVE|nr:hypothetical protein AVEN_29241-1 [Araneus ventricosus]
MNTTGRLVRSCPSNNRFCHSGADRSSNFCCRCSTMRHSHARIRRSSLSVVVHLRSDLGLLEIVPSRDHCCQQSCTVDTTIPSLSEISRKENSPSRSFITLPRPNSVRC